MSKSYKTNFEHNRNQTKNVVLDLQDNIVDSLEVALLQFKRSDNLKWKTISINIFHSLYMLCIANLEKSNYENILTGDDKEFDDRYVKFGNDLKWKRARKIYRKESEGYTIEWSYIDGEPTFNKFKQENNRTKKLINFWTAFARVLDPEVEMKGYTFSKALTVNEDEWISVEKMFAITQKLYYFEPTSSWSIEINVFKKHLKNLLNVIRFLGLKARQFFWDDEANQKTFEKILRI
ncbi:MAG: hypothetical protein ABI840_03540 [bacterium]